MSLSSTYGDLGIFSHGLNSLAAFPLPPHTQILILCVPVSGTGGNHLYLQVGRDIVLPSFIVVAV